jgi:ATP-dependent DNA helicase RecG
MDTIPQKESEKAEFKSSFDSECIETLAAFANSRGGSVYVGIGDEIFNMHTQTFNSSWDYYIEFFNPGRLPDRISIENLINGNYVSICRNKLVSKLFKEINWIEKYGTGIRRVTNLFLAYGAPAPVFENFQHGFRVTAYPGKSDLEIGNNLDNGQKNTNDLENDLVNNSGYNLENNSENDLVNDPGNDLSENQQRILSEMQKNRQIAQKKLSRIIGISEKNIRININALKGKGFIERVGPDKGGYWKILI